LIKKELMRCEHIEMKYVLREKEQNGIRFIGKKKKIGNSCEEYGNLYGIKIKGKVELRI
jgi:hypothetical protein